MKLNNKGFAISTIMYMILIMAVILITLTLSLLNNRKFVLDKIKEEAKEDIYTFVPRLPIEYQEVRYIESTGLQYINTGLVGKPGYTVEANIAFTDISTNDYQYFAGYADMQQSTNRIFYIALNNNNTTPHLGYTYGSNNIIAPVQLEQNKFYNIKSVMKGRKQELFLNGNLVDSSSFTWITDGSDDSQYIYMFNSNSLEGSSKVRSRDVKWYDQDNTLIRYFVPCYRRVDGAVGMYDLVEEIFYENSGEGKFIKGPDRK